MTEMVSFFECGFNHDDNDGDDDDTPIPIVNGSKDNSIVSRVSSHFPFIQSQLATFNINNSILSSLLVGIKVYRCGLNRIIFSVCDITTDNCFINEGHFLKEKSSDPV